MVLKIIKFVLDVFILCVSYFVPKKRNLTIYGEWFGLTANRETFSFYLNDASLYKKVWITKDINLYNKLRKQIDIHMAYSIKGLYLQLRAERFIVNVSSNDIARGVTVRAKEFILVGHGIPVKTFLLSEKRGILYTLLLKIKFLLFENYTTIFYPFQDFIDIYKKAYNSSVDVLKLFNPKDLYPIVINRNVSEYFEIIYLPTHQNEGINYDYVRDQKFYETICNIENVNLTVVLHPYEWKYLNEIQNKFNYKNITFTIQNPNDFLGKVNFAITDYSGSIYGYLYNKLPVVFFHSKNNILLTRKFIKPPIFLDYKIVYDLNDLVSLIEKKQIK